MHELPRLFLVQADIRSGGGVAFPETRKMLIHRLAGGGAEADWRRSQA